MPTITLFDEFEVRGAFWIPSNPDRRLAGTLKYSSREGIALHLFGAFHELQGFSDEAHFQEAVILGVAEGKAYTLYKNYRKSGNFTIGGHGIVTSIYETLYLFVGEHFQTLEQISGSKLRVNYTNLERWLARVPFETQMGEPGAEGPRLTARYHTPPTYSQH